MYICVYVFVQLVHKIHCGFAHIQEVLFAKSYWNRHVKWTKHSYQFTKLSCSATSLPLVQITAEPAHKCHNIRIHYPLWIYNFHWNFVHTIERAAALPDTYSMHLGGHILYICTKQYREGINIIVTDIVNRSSITLNQQQTTLLKDNLRSPCSSRHHWHTWRHYWASRTCMRSSGSRPRPHTGD